MDSFLTGRGWDEIGKTFAFVELDSFTDPVPAYAFILMLSVLVSLISATYYFKIYELMGPAASEAEISSQTAEHSVQMIHDGGSLMVVGLLSVLIVMWIGSFS